MLLLFLSKRKQCVKNSIEYLNWVTSRNGSRTFNFHNVYQWFPGKKWKKEDVLQFADDACIISPSKSNENLLCEINGVFQQTDSYMRQNMLYTEIKPKLWFFSKNGEPKIEKLPFNGIFKKPKTSCRYLGIIIDNTLNFFIIQINKTLAKMANVIRSFYLVGHLETLKQKSVFLNHVFCPILVSVQFVSNHLLVMSLQRGNRQINWGKKVCHLSKKFDTARDLLLKDKILPAELFIKKSWSS